MNRINAPYALEVLTYRPGAVAWRYAQGDPLIRGALDHGRVLYERTN